MDRTYRDAGIQSVKMVGASNHEDAVIALQAVYFIQEIAPDVIRDDGV